MLGQVAALEIARYPLTITQATETMLDLFIKMQFYRVMP